MDKKKKLESIRFKYVLFKELDDLEALHPMVAKLSAGDLHRPTNFNSLRKSPDIYPDFPCYFYLHDDNSIVSSYGAVPDVFYRKEKPFNWAWAGALITDPAYRGCGLGTRIIQDSVGELHKRNIAWGGVFSTPTALHIYKKLHFSVLGYANRFLFLKSGKAVFDYHLKTGLLAVPASFVFKYAMKIYLSLKGQPKNLTKLKVQYFNIDSSEDGRIKGKIPECKYQTQLHFNDSIQKLFWKVNSSPNLKLYIVESTESKLPIGYFVIKNRLMKSPLLEKYKDVQLMTLMDFGFFSDDAQIFSKLFQSAFNLFKNDSADVFEVVSSSEDFSSYIKNAGLRKAGKGMSYVFTAPSGWNLEGEADNIANWPMTHFCGDGFAFA